ncbi:MAG TPA: lytic transglycosylase domain-containing protein [Baekduia sp.]|nr:lytic transglycosylase domain-containing protein [Baekduia sp.]
MTPIVLAAPSLAGFPVPAELLPLFQAAGGEYGVPWEVLAAINEIETRYGRNAGTSSAGAVGFMQFLPSTWARWGRDADGDRRRDPRNPADAIFSAARYLRGAGAADDLGRAIFAYNHADWYVEDVLHRARELAGLDVGQVAALTDQALRRHRRLYEVAGSPFFGAGVVEPSPGQALLMTQAQLVRRVLSDDGLAIYGCGRQDIVDGRIDRRVLATLLYLAKSGYHLTISSLECGHGRLTSSGNVSAHSVGGAVDIAAVNGIPILGHQGAGSITDEVVHRLLDLQGLTRPAQIISLMTVDGASNTLALADHDDHIHVGFGRAVEVQDA